MLGLMPGAAVQPFPGAHKPVIGRNDAQLSRDVRIEIVNEADVGQFKQAIGKVA